MKSWFKEPLLHFLVAGGLLFGAYAWLNPPALVGDSGSREVRIGAGEVRWLTETWVRQWRREPTPEELRALVTDLLKEELLAREARELRLDENDTIVRRRLAQKLEFLVRDTAGLAEPTEEDLRRFYADHADDFRSAARVSFAQVHFSRERRKDAARDAALALARLTRATPPATPDVGDSMLLPPELRDADEHAVAAAFGPDFARAVFALQPGGWHGPIESGYGLHLVRVASVEPTRRREFAEVRAQLLERWREQRSREREAQYLARLMEKYSVVIDESVKPLVGSPSLARSGTEAAR